MESRIRDTGVEAVVLPIGWRNVPGRGDCEVVAVELLDIPRIPNPRFVHYIGTRGPGPASDGQSGPHVKLRFPLRPRLHAGVIKQGVVDTGIHCAPKAVALIQVVSDLGYPIVGPVVTEQIGLKASSSRSPVSCEKATGNA